MISQTDLARFRRELGETEYHRQLELGMFDVKEKKNHRRHLQFPHVHLPEAHNLHPEAL